MSTSNETQPSPCKWLFVNASTSRSDGMDKAAMKAVRRHTQPHSARTTPGSRRDLRQKRHRLAKQQSASPEDAGNIFTLQIKLPDIVRSSLDSADPFRSLPLHVNEITNFLIIHYGQVTEPEGPRYASFRQVLQHRRHNIWLKSILQDEATSLAFFAAIASSPDVPQRYRNREAIIKCVTRALHLNAQKLRSLGSPVDDNLNLATYFLSISAANSGDERALASHGMGHAAQVLHRYAANTLDTFTASQLEEELVRPSCDDKRGFPGLCIPGLEETACRLGRRRVFWTPEYQAILKKDSFVSSLLTDHGTLDFMNPWYKRIETDQGQLNEAFYLAFRMAVALMLGPLSCQEEHAVTFGARVHLLHDFMMFKVGSATWASRTADTQPAFVLWMACLGAVATSEPQVLADCAEWIKTCVQKLGLSSSDETLEYLSAHFPWPQSYETEMVDIWASGVRGKAGTSSPRIEDAADS